MSIGISRVMSRSNDNVYLVLVVILPGRDPGSSCSSTFVADVAFCASAPATMSEKCTKVFHVQVNSTSLSIIYFGIGFSRSLEDDVVVQSTAWVSVHTRHSTFSTDYRTSYCFSVSYSDHELLGMLGIRQPTVAFFTVIRTFESDKQLSNISAFQYPYYTL